MRFHAMRGRRLLAGLLTVLVLAGTLAAPALAGGHGNGHDSANDRGHGRSVTFTDVSSSHWAWSYISAMGAKGILSGYGDGRFGPQNHVSRLELVVMVTRLLGAEEVALDLEPAEVNSILAGAFNDWRKLPAWPGARECLAYAVKEGYAWPLMQNASHNFQYRTAATRVEVVATLLEAMGLGAEARAMAGTAIDFRDASAVPGWARGYVALAIDLGILTGDGGNLRPNHPVTRCEMAALLERADAEIDTDLDRAVVCGTVTAIHRATSASDVSTITVHSGTTATYELLPNVVVMLDDVPGRLSDIAVGDRVALYLDEDGKVILIDLVSEEDDGDDEDEIDQITGTLVSWTLDASNHLTTITVRRAASPPDTRYSGGSDGGTVTGGRTGMITATFTVAAGATLTRDGRAVPVSALTEGLTLRLDVQGGVVTAIEVLGKSEDQRDVVTGTITRVTVGTGTAANVSSISIIPTGQTAAGEETYLLASGAVVVVNSALADLRDVRPGDAAVLHLDAQDRVALLVVEYAITEASGTVTAVTRDAAGKVTTLTLQRSGSSTTYLVAADAEITFNGSAISSSHLTAGDTVEIRIARGSVVAIDITTDVN